jgi:outer membrane protein
MKNPIRTLSALLALGAASIAAQAQPAIKILVVDMAKLYDTHYKTIEQTAKLQADDQKASEEVTRMNTEGNALVEEYKALNDQATNNPALTPEAKAKAAAEAQKKYEAIQQKKNEVGTFVQNTQRSLQQRLQTFRSLMLEEISKTAADVAKRKGATLLIDKAGPTIIGISSIIYSDPSYDITDEVQKELNKDRPANAPTTAAPMSASPASGSSGGDANKISVPAIPKK